MRQASDQQSGRHEEHERQRDFRRDENGAETSLAAAGCRRSRSVLEIVGELPPRSAQRRKQTDDHAREHRHRKSETEHDRIDRHRAGRQQRIGARCVSRRIISVESLASGQTAQINA